MSRVLVDEVAVNQQQGRHPSPRLKLKVADREQSRSNPTFAHAVCMKVTMLWV